MDSLEVDSPVTVGAPTPLPSRTHYPCPERGLMLAVLEQALSDLRLERTQFRRWRRRGRAILPAQAWLEGRDSRWPFSFENVCEQLGLDATAVRRVAGVTAR